MQLFGFEIKRKKADSLEKRIKSQSIAVKSTDDGTYDIAQDGPAGATGHVLNIEGFFENEAEQINKYREMALQPELDSAIEDIVSEAIVQDDMGAPVELNLDSAPNIISKETKEKIIESFNEVLSMMDFNRKGHDIFRSWYVDGRLFYQKIIDPADKSRGVVDLIKLDPRRLKKLRTIDKEVDERGIELVEESSIFYLYDPSPEYSNNMNNNFPYYQMSSSGEIIMTEDTVAYASSGRIDNNTGIVMSYLHGSLKAYNQLRMMEDSALIYAVSRAPERRVFYIDVGNMPVTKARQYVKSIMNEFNNKLVYDATTGEILHTRNNMSILEDYWIPRRESGPATEITTLKEGGMLDDFLPLIEFFAKKLLKTLKVPLNRLDPQTNYFIGRSSEITREELKYNRFINRLRNRFVDVFDQILKTHLVLKGVLTEEEWDEIRGDIEYQFASNSYFTELKEAEVLRERIDTFERVKEYMVPNRENGEVKIFPMRWVLQNILRLSDEEIDENEKSIKKEEKALDEVEDEAEKENGGQQQMGPMVPGQPPQQQMMPQQQQPPAPAQRPAPPPPPKPKSSDDDMDVFI